MECAVYDTYVRKKEGGLMHFDIIVPTTTDSSYVFDYGREYLIKKGQQDQPLTAKECRFCHIEQAEPKIEAEIVERGYYILEMQGC